MRRRGIRLAVCLLALAVLGALVAACARVEAGSPVSEPTFPSVAAGPSAAGPSAAGPSAAGPSAAESRPYPASTIDGRSMFDLGNGVRIYAFWTPGGHDRPWSVMVHGGSWRWGDAADASYVDWTAHEKSRGWAAFSIDYRLVPSVVWPAPEDDVQRAVAWIRAHADFFGLAPTHGFLVGHSAGGQLASIAALQHGGFAGVVDAAGAVDPYTLYRTARSASLRHASALLIGGRVDSRLAWERVNAASYLGAHVMPFLVVHSVDDPEVPFAVGRTFAQELRTHGYPTRFYPVAGTSHGLWSASVTAAIDRWMDAVLARRTATRSP